MGAHLCEGYKPSDQPKGNQIKCTAGKPGHTASWAALACTDILQVLLVLGDFLCPILWYPKAYFSLFLNSELRSNVIYGEPEAQLGAEEEGTGGSKSVRKRTHFGALAWGCAVVTNFCQREGLSPKIPLIITTLLSLLPQLCDTALWSTTKQPSKNLFHPRNTISCCGSVKSITPKKTPMSQRGSLVMWQHWKKWLAENKGTLLFAQGFVPPVNENLMKTLIFKNVLFSSDL